MPGGAPTVSAPVECVAAPGVSRVTAPERHGYVTHAPNPANARTRIIKPTPHGRQELRVMRSKALDLEERWHQLLGRRRFGEPRTILQMLLDTESAESAESGA
jgi:hypothetical protein